MFVNASRELQVFKSIPYARPPVNELRWKDPLYVLNYRLARRVLTYVHSCTGLLSHGQEFCKPLKIHQVAPR